MIPAIEVDELKRRRDAGETFAIIDVREPWEVAIASIPGSVNVPLAQLEARSAEIPNEGSLVVVCHHGGRSAHATTWLRGQGFTSAVNLDGGVDSWARNIDPSMPRY
ncbi:rhodanese-like domain-containing protein [Roseiterribacter gracilis]|uniref:Rhodanese-like domain-containing protein n=1 Tax=Roseiterribacter gracilis TaxID=2812848 RepID=A0A8S8X617_9PROT|nr:rhodanese-like domain-containing protein [Rhodospirillales bacterium TMPK1]